jgi:hypothetical protein
MKEQLYQILGNAFDEFYYQYVEDINRFSGRKYFFEAISSGNIDKVSRYLELGADVNQEFSREFHHFGYADYRNYTPLGWAIARRKGEIVRKLIENGADVNHGIDNRHYHLKPIYIAAENGDAEIISLLIEQGADEAMLTDSYKNQFKDAIEIGKAKYVKPYAVMGQSLKVASIIKNDSSKQDSEQKSNDADKIKVSLDVISSDRRRCLTREQRSQQFVELTIGQAKALELPIYYQQKNTLPMNVHDDALAVIASFAADEKGKNKLTELQKLNYSNIGVKSMESGDFECKIQRQDDTSTIIEKIKNKNAQQGNVQGLGG